MTQLECIDREIERKRKCYVICRAYDAADFDATLACACEEAAACGAQTLYFAMRDKGKPLTEEAYTLAGRRFVFDTEFVILDKALTDMPAGVAPLRTKRMHAQNEALFRAIYNEAFFDVPNSRTMDDAETRAIEVDEKRDAGFFMLGGEPVGVFVLDSRGATPEIEAICIRADFRRQGYGTRALHTLEARLAAEGYGRVALLVAERNTAAYALYNACGYAYSRTLSRWYRTQL